ncbi:MAG TPA: DUF4838 domain-containing protein [Candidatus Hydrogenedentes bacterium]|nr:DUF4838 domain-containing protein [Candidatus Hydrogenedentota bacterium]HPG67290.1 DUF4838 domain-containing protein [Candidatus Hydrogenedentota bacterium]
MHLVTIAAIALSSAVCAVPQGVNLAALDGWEIVVAPDAIASEVFAAEELQALLEQAGAPRLPIAQEGDRSDPTDRTDHRFFVGPGQALQGHPAGFSVEGFGEEDFRVVIRDNAILIAGGRPRGTLYGVYSFLEDHLGVRFLTVDHTHVPPIGDWRVVGPADRFYHPPLAFRWSFYAETNRSPLFAARNRTNTVPTEPRLGGKTGLENINHSFCHLMPSREFGKEHPEYYALVDGQRLADVENDGVQTELCLTNPDVLRIVTERVLAILRAHPEQRNISVSQNDNTLYCRCPKCASLDEREESPMGSLLTFVNAVADEVANEFPDVLVGTLAYSYSRKPPKTVRPRPNVQIHLCSGECCLLHAIDDPDCPMNRDFCRDMTTWGSMCKNISIWNYNTNFANYLLPCPNLRVVEPNIRYFVANNAIGVFMQGVWNGQGGEFSDLRNYIISGLLWDPNRSGEALMDEFLTLHYKVAAPPIRRFVNLTHDNAARLGIHRACSGSAADYGIDQHIAQAGLDAFAEALELAGDDGLVRARVEKASVCAYRAALEPFFNLSSDGMADPELIARMAPLLERFTALCETYGVEMLSEGGTFEAFKTQQLPVEALSGRRVLELPEHWAFKTDPENVGEDQAWFDQVPDDSWKPISILEVWEGQGYDRYDGYAWYTVDVDVPEIEAEAVWLLCGAVDETFDVWINGQYVGERKGNPQSVWDKPAAVDITGKFAPDQKNRITMRVHDVGYAGGIWKPVWITANP